MFNIGDLVIYSSHGICYIDNIVENTYSGITRNYYVLHPLKDNKLKISIPIDNNRIPILKPLTSDEADKILEVFKLPGMDWIELEGERHQTYLDIVKKGDRKGTAIVVNTLMRKKLELESKGKKFHEKDNHLLVSIQGVLFEELAFTLNTTVKSITETVICFINADMEMMING